MTAQNIVLQIIPVQGNSIGAANLLVVPHGLSIPSLLYADAGLTTPLANPLPVDSTGSVDFWVADNTLTYDGFLSGGLVVGRPQFTNLYALASPQTATIYQFRYFTLDLVPQLGGRLGDIVVSAYYHGTTSLAPIYQANDPTTTITNPIDLTNNAYNISFWADPAQQLDLKLEGDHLASTVTVQNIWSLPAPIWADKGVIWQNEPHVWAWVSPYNVTVKTIANVGQLYTGLDLVRAAMRLIQVSAVDTDLTASELQDGIESLNRMIDSWSLDELILYQVIREAFPLVSGQNPYTIGLGGDWDTTRPTKIVGAYLTLNNGSIPVDYPMQVIGYDDYNAIRLKTLNTNFPGYLYYQPNFPIAEAYIYPVFTPNDPSTQGPALVTLTSWKPLELIADPTAYISLPPGYWEAVVFNLALRIAEEYQFEIRQTTVQIAVSSMKRLKRMNQRTPTLQTDVALMNQQQVRYNIFSDSNGR
jgi:hypothetical protein